MIRVHVYSMEVLPSHHRRQALVKVSRSIKHWRAGARDKGRGTIGTGKPYVNKGASLCGGRRAAYRGDLRGERNNCEVRISKQESFRGRSITFST